MFNYIESGTIGDESEAEYTTHEMKCIGGTIIRTMIVTNTGSCSVHHVFAPDVKSITNKDT